MKRFDSIKDGLAAMKQLTESQNKKVGALLTFQNTSKKQVDACFLFESIESPDSQLIGLYPGSLAISGESKADMPHLLSARSTAMSAVLSVMDTADLGIVPHGHAEEFLIENFETCLGQVSDIANVTVYVSHSPCTKIDARPSNTLHGWPASCTAKFAQLASVYSKYHFSVCFWKEFGVLAGKGATIENDLKKVSGGLSNLAFVKL
jgi:hypothetical protein